MADVILRNLQASKKEFKSALAKLARTRIQTAKGQYVLGRVIAMSNRKRGDYAFLEIPFTERPGNSRVRRGDIAFRFVPKSIPGEQLTLTATCYVPETEPFFSELLEEFATQFQGTVEIPEQRPLHMVSEVLIDKNNFSELTQTLARISNDVVTLPRERLLQVLSNLPHGAPVDWLENAARGDSLYVPINRRNLLKILLGQTTQGENRAHKPSGRPRDAINKWARQQMKSGRDRQLVFQEWLAKRRERGDNVDTLADPYDSFKQAIKGWNEESDEESSE